MSGYARNVILHLDPERWEEAMEFAASIGEEIAAFPGLVSWTLSGDRSTGRAISHSVFASREAFLSVNPQINQIVSAFAAFFVAPPEETLGDVVIAVQGQEDE